MKTLVILTVGVAICCSVAVGQQCGEWRAPWKVTLAGHPSGAAPESLSLRFENQGNVTLAGENVVFSLFRGGSMYGWAIDPLLRAEKLAIPPGGVIERTSKRKDLRFRDLKGDEIPRSRAEEDFAAGDWEIRASLTDTATPKPGCESSFLIWSSTITFGETSDE
jgi:hypothetical protein